MKPPSRNQASPSGGGIEEQIELILCAKFFGDSCMKVRTEQRGRVTIVVSNAHDGTVMKSGWDIQAITVSPVAETSEKHGAFLTEADAVEAAFERAKELGLM